MKIKELLSKNCSTKNITIRGWVRTKRGSKNVSFIALNDGSSINNIQIVAEGRSFSEDLLKEFSINAIFYDPDNFEDLREKVSKKTKMILVENPGSNTFDFQDLGKIISIAKKNKILTAIDNTWGTPYFLKPIKLGFDMSIVSATKYYSGHSDVMGGSLAVNKKVFAKVKAAERVTGLRLGPDDAYLITRGLRTLDIRLDRHRAVSYTHLTLPTKA